MYCIVCMYEYVCIDTAIDEHELQRVGDGPRVRGVVDCGSLQRLVQPLLAVKQFAQHLRATRTAALLSTDVRERERHMHITESRTLAMRPMQVMLPKLAKRSA